MDVQKQETNRKRLHVAKKTFTEEGKLAEYMYDAWKNQTSVEALCGYEWVPKRFFKFETMCEECAKLFVERIFNNEPAHNIQKPPGNRRGHEPSCEGLFGYHCTCQ